MEIAGGGQVIGSWRVDTAQSTAQSLPEGSLVKLGFMNQIFRR
jgi:hypothetical protein